MFKKILSCVSFVIVSVFLLVSVSLAQKKSAVKKLGKEKVPVVITADQAEFNNKARKAIYKGNVKVVRGDSTMYSNELEAFLDQKGEEIDHIVATGDVIVLQEGKRTTAQKGVYYEAEQKVILTGNPISRDGKNVVKGSRMIYFFNQERILVEDAISELHPDDTKKQNKSKTTVEN